MISSGRNCKSIVINTIFFFIFFFFLSENLGISIDSDESTKMALVKKYIEFKQLMLKIDPAEEDEEEKLASAMRAYQVSESPLLTDSFGASTPLKTTCSSSTASTAGAVAPALALAAAATTTSSMMLSMVTATPPKGRGRPPGSKSRGSPRNNEKSSHKKKAHKKRKRKIESDESSDDDSDCDPDFRGWNKTRKTWILTWNFNGF